MNTQDIAKNNIDNQANFLKNFLTEKKEETQKSSIPGFNEAQMGVIKKGIEQAFEKSLMSDADYDKACLELSKFKKQEVEVAGKKQFRYVKIEIK